MSPVEWPREEGSGWAGFSGSRWRMIREGCYAGEMRSRGGSAGRQEGVGGALPHAWWWIWRGAVGRHGREGCCLAGAVLVVTRDESGNLNC